MPITPARDQDPLRQFDPSHPADIRAFPLNNRFLFQTRSNFQNLFAMSSDQEQKMERLQGQLPGEFTLDKRSEYVFELHNSNCIIEVLFERFDSNQEIIFLCPPEQPSVKLHVLLLRHLRGVKISSEEQDSQDGFELIGRIIAEHFRDLLEGDFSIMDEYKRIEKRFFPAIIKVHSLRSDDPIKIMYRECDIDWLDALERREQQNSE